MAEAIGQPILRFWFEFASTYSYPAAMRIEDDARQAGVALTWSAFLLGPIFADAGMADSPFNLHVVKGRYMWRDMERLCSAAGLPFRRPSVFPRGSLLATRICTAFADAPWLPAFVRAVYVANFGEDRDIGVVEVIGEILTDIGGPAAAILAAATTPEVKAALRNTVDAARDAGIFGAPSFTISNPTGGPPELFWGGDRMAAALAFAKSASPPSARTSQV